MWLEKYPHLKAEDIAEGVLYLLGTPPHVQVRRISARKTVTVVMTFDIRYLPQQYFQK
jgi:NADP-dependent 3-hydroxy acid dehydrogenase YdfG